MVSKGFNYKIAIQRIRKALGISQEDLARELGVSFGTVNRWENGKVNPSKLAKRQLNSFIEHQVSVGNIKPSEAIFFN